MKRALKALLFFSVAMGIGFPLKAQDTPPSPSFKESTVNKLSKLMDDYYVSPEIAEKTSQSLKQKWKDGHFDSFETYESFAESLTNEVRLISQDKHQLIRPSRPLKAEKHSMARILERHTGRLAYDRSSAGGFHEVKFLSGNVGYLDIRSFAPLELGSSYADSYMKLLSTSDAIIIDLRENGGGHPAMVQYLCSYFFAQKTHLNSLYWREGDRTDEFWTLDNVNGEKLPDIPLFVLTSERTFSGAEEFSYNMQTQKRATLVGQTTRGGANPGRLMPINEKLEVFIPIGKAINPITKTNWEGVGVVPDVKASPDETLAKAHQLAKIAAEEYSMKVKQNQTQLFAELLESFETFTPETGSETVFNCLQKCKQAGLLERRMINGLGYEYLMNFGKPKLAEAILRSNTLFYPDSANVFDSYAESLVENGKNKEAAQNYQRAIEIAIANDDPGLQFFQEHLKKLETKENK